MKESDVRVWALVIAVIYGDSTRRDIGSRTARWRQYEEKRRKSH